MGSLLRARFVLCVPLLLWMPACNKAGKQNYSVLGPPPSRDVLERHQRVQAILSDGWGIQPAEAAKIEEELARNPGDVAARLRLISYHAQHSRNDDRVRHLLWMVEQHPESEVFEGGGAGVFGLLSTAPEYPRFQALWRQQAIRNPKNPAVLANAAFYVAPETSLQLIAAARAAEPRNPEWTRWLAKNYSNAIRWTYWDGKTMIYLTDDADDSRHVAIPALPLALCSRLKRNLESSTDGELIEAIGESLLREIRLLQQQGQSQLTPELPQVRLYAEQLVSKGRVLQNLKASL